MLLNNKTKPRALTIAICAILASLSGIAQAELTDSHTQSFYVTNRVSIDGNPDASIGPSSGSGPSYTFSGFDSNLGVLTGATLSVSGTRTQTVSGFGINSNPPFDPNFPLLPTVYPSGSGNMYVDASSPVFYNSLILGGFNTSGGCIGEGICDYTRTESNSFSDSISTSGAAFWDGSDVTVNTQGTVSLETAGFVGDPADDPALIFTQATLETEFLGDATLDYQYLLHSDPYTSGNIDFGTVQQNASVTDQLFLLGNAGTSDRIGWDILSVTAHDDFDKFSATPLLEVVTNQMGENQYWFGFDTSTVGVFSALYDIVLRDTLNDDAAQWTYKDYSLTLLIQGTVEAVTTSVPEPATLMLLSLGLLGFGFRKAKPASALTA